MKAPFAGGGNCFVRAILQALRAEFVERVGGGHTDGEEVRNHGRIVCCAAGCRSTRVGGDCTYFGVRFLLASARWGRHPRPMTKFVMPILIGGFGAMLKLRVQSRPQIDSASGSVRTSFGESNSSSASIMLNVRYATRR